MQRVSVSELRIGERLTRPLFDEDGRLLLAANHVLTKSVITQLRRRGLDEICLGAEHGTASESRLDLSGVEEPFRQDAACLVEVLNSELANQSGIAQGDDSITATGNVDEYLGRILRGGRSPDEIKIVRHARAQGIAFVREVVEGSVSTDQAVAIGRDVVEEAVDAFARDHALLTTLVNLKDTSDYIYTHSMNSAILSLNIAHGMNFTRQQMVEIGLSALFHDLGMSMVPSEVLNRPAKLTPIEFVDIQKHTAHSLYILQQMRGLPRIVAYVAHQHHERSNGKGYPQRRTSQAIHPAARIVAVADVYDALTTDRPWRKAIHPYRAVRQIIRDAVNNSLDGVYVNSLLEHISLYPLGTLVRLDSGEIARVVRANGRAFSRPVVVPVEAPDGAPIHTEETIDLVARPDVNINAVVDSEPSAYALRGFESVSSRGQAGQEL